MTIRDRDTKHYKDIAIKRCRDRVIIIVEIESSNKGYGILSPFTTGITMSRIAGKKS